MKQFFELRESQSNAQPAQKKNYANSTSPSEVKAQKKSTTAKQRVANRKAAEVDENTMGHIGAVQGMLAKERDLEKSRDARKAKQNNTFKDFKKAPKIGADNVAKIRAQDQANKSAKAKPMNSTQRSLASIRAKSESVEVDEKTGIFGGKYTSKDKMVGMKNFSAIRDKKQKQRDAEHQASDPKMSKMGYAKHMVDMDKAKSKAAKKGADSTKTARSDYDNRNGMTPNRKLPEDAHIDEISMTKMAAYAPKAVKSKNDAMSATYSADTNRWEKAKKTLARRKAGANNYNKKMWGYANVAPTKESVDEAKVGPSHDQIMKAIGHTKNSAQGIAILQKKFKLSPKEARKHMDMFLKDDVQVDEMGAFLSSPLPTPMSMRKDPSMTRPLMLTKRMNTAATLIKKAGNTPVSPTK